MKYVRQQSNQPFTFFSFQCSFWTFVSRPAWHIAALSVWSIPIFQDVSDTVIETFKLISCASMVWIAAQGLCHLYQSRWRRQILCYSNPAIKRCVRNFVRASIINIHICQQPFSIYSQDVTLRTYVLSLYYNAHIWYTERQNYDCRDCACMCPIFSQVDFLNSIFDCFQMNESLFSGTHEDERTVLYKTRSLDGTKPNINPKTSPKTNLNPNSNHNPNDFEHRPLIFSLFHYVVVVVFLIRPNRARCRPCIFINGKHSRYSHSRSP